MKAFFHEKAEAGESQPRAPRERPHGCWKLPSLWNPVKSKNTCLEQQLSAVDALLLGHLKHRIGEPPAAFGDDVRRLLRLRQDAKVVFRKADKSASLCIVSRDSYLQEALSMRHLGNSSVYKVLPWSEEEALARLVEKTHAFVGKLFSFAKACPLTSESAWLSPNHALGYFT